MKAKATRKENSKTNQINLRKVEKALQIGIMRILSFSVKTKKVTIAKRMSKGSPRVSICHFKLIGGGRGVWLSLLQR